MCGMKISTIIRSKLESSRRTKPGFAAIGYRHFEAVTLETDLDGRADQGIVIDDENACHVSSRRQNTYLQPSPYQPSVATFAVT